MAQAKTLTTTEIERLLTYINTRKYSARNRAMMLLTHLAGLRIGEVACLRWSDVMNLDGAVKDEIRLLPDMTKGRHARTVFVNNKLREELQAYAEQAKCVDRSYPFFASQKSIRAGFNANSLAQTFAVLYAGAGLEGASSHSGRRTFFNNTGHQRHCHPYLENACWSPQHQHYCCIPVHQPNPVKSSCGIGLIIVQIPFCCQYLDLNPAQKILAFARKHVSKLLTVARFKSTGAKPWPRRMSLEKWILVI